MSVFQPVESSSASPIRRAAAAAARTALPRSRFAPFSFRDAPGWIVSLAFHVLALLVMLAYKIHTEAQQDSSILSSLEEIETEQFLESTATDQVGTSEEATSLTAAGSAAVALHSADRVQQEIQQKVDEEFKTPDVPLADDSQLLTEAEITGTVDLPGGSVENMAANGGVEGAIDRLSWEIMQSLRQAKTTVVWLFDQSLSLKERRDTIADRFENVYRQLESMEQGGHGALQTAVATYGKTFTLLTDKPVDDVRTVIPRVRSIPNDPSGVENVFGAVHSLATRFRAERAKKRNVLIFIVTDEKGDDADRYLEETILLCRRAGIKVYTVGNAALFGREKGYVKWKYPDGTVSDEPVDSGPETVEPEALAMSFWGGRGPDLSRMSSGYGPYGLTRLCKESGGLFFIAQEEAHVKFPPAVMRTYQPDYRPIRDYQSSLSRNKAKAALVMSAKQTKIENLPLPRLSFQAYNDNIFREETTEAQKPLAELTYKINQIVDVLAQGEKDREKIAEPRWRAAYDLAMGRALAMKVRALGYNQMLADMKVHPKPFQKKDSNEWQIAPSKTINAGQATKKIERQAMTYLKRVMDEHPDTPWALLAEREITIPMGWEWKEFNNPRLMPANTSPEQARRQIQLAEEKARQKAPKRPAPPQRERPKL